MCLTLGAQRVAEVGLEAGILRPDGNRPAQERDGEIGAAAAEEEHPEQVERFRLVGVTPENGAAELLGLPWLPEADVVPRVVQDPGVVQRSHRRHAERSTQCRATPG